MNPLVSILIPSYNHSQYIIEALNSVKEDSYSNKELIIIDDGSKDSSPTIIANWIKENTSFPVKFLGRSNRGVCATLNELVDLANGKYVLLLASDDYLVNNTIQERVNILERNPGKLVLVSDAEVIDHNGRKIFDSSLEGFHKKNKLNYNSDENILDEILFNFGISGAVVLINKQIYDLVGKYPNDLKAEDLYFYAKAAILKKIIFYDRIVSGYRVHDMNVSANKNPELLKAVMETYLKIIHLVPGIKRKTRIVKNILWIVKYIGSNQKMRGHFLKKILK